MQGAAKALRNEVLCECILDTGMAMPWNLKASNPWDNWQNYYPRGWSPREMAKLPSKVWMFMEGWGLEKLVQSLPPPTSLQPETTACRHLLPRLPSPCPHAGCSDSNQRTPPHLSFTVRTWFLHPLPAPTRVPGPKLHWPWWYIYIYFPCGCMCKCVHMHACFFVDDSLTYWSKVFCWIQSLPV